jgi:hypothetical protein
MRAILLLLLLLVVTTFVSFFGSALRPYWEERLPRVASHLGRGEFREAASAMVDEEIEEAEPSSMIVTTSPSEADTSHAARGPDSSRNE